MEDKNKNNNNTTERPGNRNNSQGGRFYGNKRRSDRRRGQRKKNEMPEYDQKILDIARVTRVTAGGRRFNFRITMIIGNRNGKVGVATGRGKDVAIAIDKAINNAKKNIFQVPMTPAGTIPHETEGKYSSAKVIILPSKAGKGIIAGGPTRIVCELAGYKDLSAKIIGRTTNKLNNAQATVTALKNIDYVYEANIDKTKKEKVETNKEEDKKEVKDTVNTKEEAKDTKK